MKRKSGKTRKSKKVKLYTEDLNPDYYAALDLPPGAGTVSIRRACRQLSLLYQRDTYDHEELARANRIWEAVTTLLISNRRFVYDELFRSNPEEFETNKNTPDNYRKSDINWRNGHHPPYVPGSHEAIRQELLRIFHTQGQRELQDAIFYPARRQMLECLRSNWINRIKELELRAKRLNIPTEYLGATTPKTRTGRGTLMPAPPDELRVHGEYLALLNHLEYIETSLEEMEEMRWKSSKNWDYIMTRIRSCLNVWREEDRAADRELRQLKRVYAGRNLAPFTRKFATDSDWDNSFLERSLYARKIWEEIRRYLAFRKTFQQPDLSLEIPPRSAEEPNEPHRNSDDDTDKENENNGKEENRTKSKNKRNKDRKKRNRKLNKKKQWLLTFLRTFPLLDWELEFGPPTPPPDTPVLASASGIVDMDVIRSYSA